MCDTPGILKQQVDKILSEKSKEKFIGESCGIKLITLTNKNGIVIQVTNFGCKIVCIYTPDRDMHLNDIVLGYDTIEEYFAGNPYFGAICGRYANRVANGRFTIDGQNYQLPLNNGPNSLHGGPEGFNSKIFNAKVINSGKVQFTYDSRDMEMGYPGNLSLKLIYTLTDHDELCIEYEATTDRATHVNICCHSFFNLAGEGNGDILNHEVLINANRYTPVNDVIIPTGELAKVTGSPMDFTSLTRIGMRIDEGFEQLTFGLGYDHNWVLNKGANELGLAAVCYEPVSGRTLEVYTTQPGVQLYTGNWLDGSDKGKGGKVYHKRTALCLETQHFPDSPNKPSFPTTLLRPGSVYKESCIYKFSVK